MKRLILLIFLLINTIFVYSQNYGVLRMGGIEIMKCLDLNTNINLKIENAPLYSKNIDLVFYPTSFWMLHKIKRFNLGLGLGSNLDNKVNLYGKINTLYYLSHRYKISSGLFYNGYLSDKNYSYGLFLRKDFVFYKTKKKDNFFDVNIEMGVSYFSIIKSYIMTIGAGISFDRILYYK